MELRSNVGYARRRVTVATDSPYWNPKTETLDRERIEALQLAKLRRQCEWAARAQPVVSAALRGGALRPRPAQHARRPAADPAPDPRRLDGLAGGESALRRDPGRSAARARSASTRPPAPPGRGPLRALDSRKDWAWIAEMWCYGIWGCGDPAVRHGLHRVRLRVVHRLLGPALRDGEDRSAERARRRPDDRGACAPDHRLRRHRSSRPPRPTRSAWPRRPSASASTCAARRSAG